MDWHHVYHPLLLRNLVRDVRGIHVANINPDISILSCKNSQVNVILTVTC